jgi:hypothetical protein
MHERAMKEKFMDAKWKKYIIFTKDEGVMKKQVDDLITRFERRVTYHEPCTRSLEQTTGSHLNAPLLASICAALPCTVVALPESFIEPLIIDSCRSILKMNCYQLSQVIDKISKAYATQLFNKPARRTLSCSSCVTFRNGIFFICLLSYCSELVRFREKISLSLITASTSHHASPQPARSSRAQF